MPRSTTSESGPSALLLAATAAIQLPACQLITVPVKVAGSVAETTVKTTGAVVSAPFRAMGGNDTPSQPKSGD